jgi:hypothetical protein
MAAKIDSQSETSMTGCQKFVNWILCCRDHEDEINQSIGRISLPIISGIFHQAMMILVLKT